MWLEIVTTFFFALHETFNVIAPYRLTLKSKSHWLSDSEGLTAISQRNYSVKVQTSCCAVQLHPFPLSPSEGLRRLHLHLLRPGDGGEDGGPGHLRTPLLPGRHLEPSGLLYRHGRVSDRPASFPAVDCFVCLSVGSVVYFGVKKYYPFSSLWVFTICFVWYFSPFVSSSEAFRLCNLWTWAEFPRVSFVMENAQIHPHDCLMSQGRMEAGASLLCIWYQ